MKLGFVIPVLNQMKYALEAIDSIETKYPHKIYLERNYEVNRGVAAAWNRGTKRALEDGCDIIFILNDDIILNKYAVDWMVKWIKQDAKIGVLTGTDHRNSLQPNEVVDYIPSYSQDIIDAPDFAFFAFSKHAYEYIGEFDENFHPAYFEDNDYVIRTLRSGRKPVRSQNAVFYHYGSQTQNHDGQMVVSSPVFDANRNYFYAKWGGMPGEETYTNPFNDENKSWFNVDPHC